MGDKVAKVSGKQVGFRVQNEVLYRFYNFSIALFLLVLLSPHLLLISLLLLVTQGTNIFYSGPRYGRNQKIFQIIKFRTLCTAKAKELTKDRTLPKGSKIETPLGSFLRETRLDELPQLFNVLRGDMNFCGPRPVRPEIAEIERGRIPGYDNRFKVRPGLIGPTQAYFGHSASKRLRAKMNNCLVDRPVNLIAEIRLMGAIAWSMVSKVVSKLYNRATRLAAKASGRPAPVKPRHDMWVVSDNSVLVAPVEKIGLRSIEIPTLQGVGDGDNPTLCIRLSSGSVRKARICLSETEKDRVYSYTAETEAGEYTIERYALRMVVVPPKLKVVPVKRGNVRRLANLGNRLRAGQQ